MRTRAGWSLLELVLVVAILGLLVTLVTVAVQKSRQAATRSDVLNRVRQIGLGLQQYAAAHDGKLPGSRVRSITPYGTNCPLFNILPYVDPPIPYPYYTIENLGGTPPLEKITYYPIPLYHSPTDPTLDPSGSNEWMSSFAVNWQVFEGAPRLATSFGDGTSQTAGVSERYYQPGVSPLLLTYRLLVAPKNLHDPARGVVLNDKRSGTFADPNWFDVIPVTTGDPAVSRPSIVGVTFQSAPTPEQADSRFLQAATPGGLVMGMMDGHTRVIRPGVAETAFWAMVTPAAGDSTAE